MCINNLPRVALDSGEARIRTRDLLIASPGARFTKDLKIILRLSYDNDQSNDIFCDNLMTVLVYKKKSYDNLKINL